ncbi:glycosyltransferase [Phocaeicola sp.]
MKRRKLKVLILGHLDTPLRGHALSLVSQFPNEKYDVRLVVMDRCFDQEGYKYFYDVRNRLKRIFIRKTLGLIRKIKIWLYFRERLILNPKMEGRAFFIGDFNIITGDDILAKNPDFIPDLIVMAWTRTFVSSEAVRRMYELTQARFLFFFVDDAHLSGGCHFPVDCDGYMNGCHDCPAIIKGKKIAEKVMADKLRLYKGIPKYIVGVPADCRLARKSPLLGDALQFYNWVSDPVVEFTSKSVARKELGIPNGAFVAMSGAASITDVRKGLKYAVEAANILAEKHDNVYLLLLGNSAEKTDFNLHLNVKVIMPGFLDIHGLFRAFCASDCFLNMTIADSGPMMVNYSVACGTPVVSFYIGIAQDLVEHKKTGYIAQFKDSVDVARGMEFIFRLSKEERKQMSENCKHQIAKVKPNIDWADDIYENWDNYDNK